MIKDLKIKRECFVKKYQERLDLEEVNEKERIALMNSSNPKYILRNYLAQEAIQAAELGDFSSSIC